MILLATLLMPAPANTADEVLRRLAAFTGRANSLSVECKLTSPLVNVPGTATMFFVRPNQLRYELKWQQIDYRFTANEHGSMDYEANSKKYDMQNGWSALAVPRTEMAAISGASLTFPFFLVDPTMTKYVSDVKLAGHSTINGVEADELDSHIRSLQIKVFVDGEGKPVRYWYGHQNGGVQCDLSDYQLNQSYPADFFSIDPPSGFQELSLPIEDRPVGVGQKFPADGWTSSSGKLSDLFSKKDSLVVVTDEGCEPSARSLATLQKIQNSGDMNVVSITLSPAGHEPAGFDKFPTYYDPSGVQVKALQVPGTPLFYLVNRSGQIVKVWFGFDADNADAFEKDVNATLRGKP